MRAAVFGEPFTSDTVDNVDLGDELWLHPITMDYAVKFLKSAKLYGVLNRVMFGSDQMIWPSAITSSINYLNSLEFLTEEEKEMILYKNARVFLGIKNQ
jgi:predicted TIM-barrel fold metal-dependent hydrolase